MADSEAIQEAIFDLLGAAPALYAGGDFWPAGFFGVKRPANGDTPAIGYVNLFDYPYEPEPTTYRPAIYAGTKVREMEDVIAFRTFAGAKAEHRVTTIPIVIVTHDAERNGARKKRAQLVENIRSILFPHTRHALWYLLEEVKEQYTTLSTGGGAQGVAESMGVLHYQASYLYTP